MYSENDFDSAMLSWMTKHRFNPNPETNAKIMRRVRSYNFSYASVSAFERAALELMNEGEIQPFRGNVFEQSAPVDSVPQDVKDFIENPKTSAFELRRRYASDKIFRKQYDEYMGLKLKEKIAEEDGEELTPERFKAM